MIAALLALYWAATRTGIRSVRADVRRDNFLLSHVCRLIMEKEGTSWAKITAEPAASDTTAEPCSEYALAHSSLF